MKTYGYRIMAPRRSRAAVRVRVRAIETPEPLAWLIAAAIAAAVAFSTTIAARSQTPPAAAPAIPSAAEYVRQSALIDMFEVNSSRLALQKSQDPAIREFAQQIVNERGDAADTLSTAVKSGNVDVTVPHALDAPRQQRMDNLHAKSGIAFDQAYVQAQLQGHLNALDLQRAYAQSGDNPSLKELASQTAPAVQSHLAKLEVLAEQSFRRPYV